MCEIEVRRAPDFSQTSACFAVEGTQQGDCLVLHLHGELDLDGRATLLDALDQLSTEDLAVVVLDLGDLRFLDCAGIGALVEARQRVVASGAVLAARCASDRVEFVLRRTGADAVFAGPPPPDRSNAAVPGPSTVVPVRLPDADLPPWPTHARGRAVCHRV